MNAEQINIRWLDDKRRSTQTFPLCVVLAFVEALNRPAGFNLNRRPLGTWDALEGFRIGKSVAPSGSSERRGERMHPSTKRQKENKHKCFALLGGKCVECGWADARALEIDHPQSDGSQDRRGGNGYYDRVVKRLEALPLGARSDKYQLLCAKHHRIKGADKQERRGRWQHKGSTVRQSAA
jgi:hypothetical protein